MEHEVVEAPPTCEGCNFATAQLEDYGTGALASSSEFRPAHKWLCSLCANTYAGSAVQYPRQYPERNVLFTICYIGNAILQKLDSLQAKDNGDQTPC